MVLQWGIGTNESGLNDVILPISYTQMYKVFITYNTKTNAHNTVIGFEYTPTKTLSYFQYTGNDHKSYNPLAYWFCIGF